MDVLLNTAVWANLCTRCSCSAHKMTLHVHWGMMRLKVAACMLMYSKQTNPVPTLPFLILNSFFFWKLKETPSTYSVVFLSHTKGGKVIYSSCLDLDTFRKKFLDSTGGPLHLENCMTNKFVTHQVSSFSVSVSLSILPQWFTASI